MKGQKGTMLHEVRCLRLRSTVERWQARLSYAELKVREFTDKMNEYKALRDAAQQEYNEACR